MIAGIIILLFEVFGYTLSYLTVSQADVEKVSFGTVNHVQRIPYVQNAVSGDTFPQATSSVVTSSSSSLIIATATKPVDINMLSITMKPWTWIGTNNKNGVTSDPNKGAEYTVTFDFEGTLLVRAGCKTGFGLYSISQANLVIHDMIINEKNCIDEDKKIDDYLKSFSEVSYYSFNKRGELVLRTKGLYGGMMFR